MPCNTSLLDLVFSAWVGLKLYQKGVASRVEYCGLRLSLKHHLPKQKDEDFIKHVVSPAVAKKTRLKG